MLNSPAVLKPFHLPQLHISRSDFCWFRTTRGLVTEVLLYLCSISCFISMPCFSSSSLWAKAQSTGSTGVSTHGVLSLSCRACSGSLKRNTWLLPIMIRLPKIDNRQGQNILQAPKKKFFNRLGLFSAWKLKSYQI